MKVYSVDLLCHNCFRRTEVTIKYGISVKRFIDEDVEKCDNCGCKDWRTWLQTFK